MPKETENNEVIYWGGLHGTGDASAASAAGADGESDDDGETVYTVTAVAAARLAQEKAEREAAERAAAEKAKREAEEKARQEAELRAVAEARNKALMEQKRAEEASRLAQQRAEEQRRAAIAASQPMYATAETVEEEAARLAAEEAERLEREAREAVERATLARKRAEAAKKKQDTLESLYASPELVASLMEGGRPRGDSSGSDESSVSEKGSHASDSGASSGGSPSQVRADARLGSVPRHSMAPPLFVRLNSLVEPKGANSLAWDMLQRLEEGQRNRLSRLLSQWKNGSPFGESDKDDLITLLSLAGFKVSDKQDIQLDDTHIVFNQAFMGVQYDVPGPGDRPRPVEGAQPAEYAVATSGPRFGEGAQPAEYAVATSGPRPGEGAQPAEYAVATSGPRFGEGAQPAEYAVASSGPRPGEGAQPAEYAVASGAEHPGGHPRNSVYKLARKGSKHRDPVGGEVFLGFDDPAVKSPKGSKKSRRKGGKPGRAQAGGMMAPQPPERPSRDSVVVNAVATPPQVPDVYEEPVSGLGGVPVLSAGGGQGAYAELGTADNPGRQPAGQGLYDAAAAPDGSAAAAAGVQGLYEYMDPGVVTELMALKKRVEKKLTSDPLPAVGGGTPAPCVFLTDDEFRSVHRNYNGGQYFFIEVPEDEAQTELMNAGVAGKSVYDLTTCDTYLEADYSTATDVNLRVFIAKKRDHASTPKAKKKAAGAEERVLTLGGAVSGASDDAATLKRKGKKNRDTTKDGSGEFGFGDVDAGEAPADDYLHISPQAGTHYILTKRRPKSADPANGDVIQLSNGWFLVDVDFDQEFTRFCALEAELNKQGDQHSPDPGVVDVGTPAEQLYGSVDSLKRGGADTQQAIALLCGAVSVGKRGNAETVTIKYIGSLLDLQPAKGVSREVWATYKKAFELIADGLVKKPAEDNNSHTKLYAAICCSLVVVAAAVAGIMSSQGGSGEDAVAGPPGIGPGPTSLPRCAPDTGASDSLQEFCTAMLPQLLNVSANATLGHVSGDVINLTPAGLLAVYNAVRSLGYLTGNGLTALPPANLPAFVTALESCGAPEAAAACMADAYPNGVDVNIDSFSPTFAPTMHPTVTGFTFTSTTSTATTTTTATVTTWYAPTFAPSTRSPTTPGPTAAPTWQPSVSPSHAPSADPTVPPSHQPSANPTAAPSPAPTLHVPVIQSVCLSPNATEGSAVPIAQILQANVSHGTVQNVTLGNFSQLELLRDGSPTTLDASGMITIPESDLSRYSVRMPSSEQYGAAQFSWFATAQGPGGTTDSNLSNCSLDFSPVAGPVNYSGSQFNTGFYGDSVVYNTSAAVTQPGESVTFRTFQGLPPEVTLEYQSGGSWITAPTVGSERRIPGGSGLFRVRRDAALTSDTTDTFTMSACTDIDGAGSAAEVCNGHGSVSISTLFQPRPTSAPTSSAPTTAAPPPTICSGRSCRRSVDTQQEGVLSYLWSKLAGSVKYDASTAHVDLGAPR